MEEEIFRYSEEDQKSGDRGSLEPKRPGYGSIALVTVIVLLLVISALLYIGIVVPAEKRSAEQEKLTGCIVKMKEMAIRMELYSAENGGLYPESLSQLVPGCIDAIPTCPGTGRDTYSATYEVNQETHEYTFFCNGENHMKATLKRGDYPRYSSINGFSRWDGDVFVYGSNPRKTPVKPEATYIEPPGTPWRVPTLP